MISTCKLTNLITNDRDFGSMTKRRHELQDCRMSDGQTICLNKLMMIAIFVHYPLKLEMKCHTMHWPMIFRDIASN